MNAPLIALLFIVLHATCSARAVSSMTMSELIEKSSLVMVGRVTSVKPSGIITELTYPTWDKLVFEWLAVEIDAVVSIKGGKKGKSVKTFMLSFRRKGAVVSPPGVVDPSVGQYYLLCLLPTKIEGSYAGITAPFDDDRSIFLLDRSHSAYSPYRNDQNPFDQLPDDGGCYEAVWSLVDDSGKLILDGAAELRKRYKREIATPAAKDAMVHLLWKTYTDANGWQANFPADTDVVTKPHDQ